MSTELTTPTFPAVVFSVTEAAEQAKRDEQARQQQAELDRQREGIHTGVFGEMSIGGDAE